MENWAEQMISTLDEKLKAARSRDLRFFRVEEFKRNIRRTGEFSKSCPVCEKEKIPIAGIIQKIDEAIQVPGKMRREYDKEIGRLSSHMQKEHGFFPPFYFTYLFAFFGMVAGFLFGYLLMKLFPMWDWLMLVSGFVAGMIAGYVWGGIRDGKIRASNKLM